MSWSVAAKGTPQEVAKLIADQIANGTCPEPEETIKQKAGELIALALSSEAQGFYPQVEVSAGGSQSWNETSKANWLQIKIAPTNP